MDATSRIGSPAKPKEKSNSSFMTAMLVLILKGKTLLLGLAKLKYAYTLITALISIVAYSFRFGWAAAAGFVALIFVHEMGHVIMLRHYGVPASVPMFIPFIGAVVGMKGYPDSVVKEAIIALAGPVLGSIGAIACIPIYYATGNEMWAWLAYIGLFLNLFNLLPMSPLDGGRVVGAIWRGFWIIGIVAAAAIAHFMESPILLLFIIFGLDEMNRRFLSIHWAFYIAVGLLAIASSACYGEIYWGFIITFFAVTHALEARTLAKRRAQMAAAEAAMPPLPDLPPEDMPPPLPQVAAPSAVAGKTAPKPNQANFIERMDKTYFSVTPTQRFAIGAAYIGLAGTIASVMAWMYFAGLVHALKR